MLGDGIKVEQLPHITKDKFLQGFYKIPNQLFASLRPKKAAIPNYYFFLRSQVFTGIGAHGNLKQVTLRFYPKHQAPSAPLSFMVHEEEMLLLVLVSQGKGIFYIWKRADIGKSLPLQT